MPSWSLLDAIRPLAAAVLIGAAALPAQAADGENAIRLRGNVSIDGRYFTDGHTPATADTWLVRRLRPTLEGTVDGIFDFRLMPDFAQGKAVLQDGWLDMRLEPWLVLTAGKFKVPVGLERLQLEQYARFIEPSLTADLLPYRDLGLQVGGALGGRVTYALGLLDGTVDGGSTDGNTTPDANSTGRFTWDGRLYAQPLLQAGGPLRNLGFGIAGTYVRRSGIATANATGSLLAGYKSIGQQPLLSFRNATIAAGADRRLVPQIYLPFHCVSLLAEYVVEDQQVERALSATTSERATLRNRAWQLQAAWFLSGEQEAYDRTTPRRAVGQGGWGAWEIVARLHALRFDDAAFAGGADSYINPATAPRAVRAFGTGVNWYLTRHFKAQLDYEVSVYEGGAASGSRPDERVLTSQFALVF